MFSLFKKSIRNRSDDNDLNESINEKDENDQNVGLLDMPDLVMREILAYCDLTSILRLTKVCRALHYFISCSPPATNVDSLKVCVEKDVVNFSFYHYKPYSRRRNGSWSRLYLTNQMSFHYHEYGCFVVRRNDQSYLRNEDFVSIACMYLSSCIQYVGTVLDYIEIDQFDYWIKTSPSISIWKRLESVFCSFKRPSLPLPSHNEITTRVVEMKSATFSNHIRDFFNIKEVELTVENISNEEILEIKEHFMTYSTMEKMRIETSSDPIFDQTEKNDQNVGLLDMPDLVMREILAYCDLPSILRLTKVCRALYYFISRSQPSTKVYSLRIVVKKDVVYFAIYYFEPCSWERNGLLKSILIRFHYDENGCFVVRNQVERFFLRNEDFVTIACRNLNFCIRYIGTLLRFEIDQSDGSHSDFKVSERERLKAAFCSYKKLPLPSHNETTTQFMDTIESCLKSRSHPIRVRYLEMSLIEPPSNILNLVDAAFFESMAIHKSHISTEFNVRRFKNLDSVYISSRVSNPIRDFFHVKRFELILDSISKEELLEIKEQFMTSFTIKRIEITVKSRRELLDRVFDVFGAQLLDRSFNEWRLPTHTQRTLVCRMHHHTLTIKLEK